MSQTDILYNLLSDYEWHSTSEIIDVVYPAEGRERTGANYKGRVFDVKKRYGVEIESKPDSNNRRLWYYRMKRPSDYLPAINIDEFKTQPLLFKLPEIKQEVKMPN